MPSRRTTETDSFASEFAEWVDAIPGPVDESVEAVRQRIGRISRQFERVLAEVAEHRGLSVGDWEALSVLARSSYEAKGLTPTRMANLLGLTSGTVTVRIDRLVRAGFVERAEGSDKRQHPIRLTRRGAEAWGEATLARTDAERKLVHAGLSNAEIVSLGETLGKLLAELERVYGPAPRHDMTRTGGPKRA